MTDKKLTLFSLEKRVRELEAKIEEVQEDKKERFDWQEVKHCHSCNKDIPAMLERFHAHVFHGI